MFPDRIKELLDKKGSKQAELAEFVGVKQNTVSDWINRGTSPKVEHLYRIVDFFEISFDYLFRGVNNSQLTLGNDYKEFLDGYSALDGRGKTIVKAAVYQELNRIESKNSPPSKEQVDNITRVSYESDISDDQKEIAVFSQPASAGTGAFLDSDDYDMVDVPINPITIRASFGVRVNGDSMEPDYYNEEIVFVKQQPDLENGEIGVFILNGDAYIKKLSKGANSARLISLNPAYPPIRIREDDDLRVVGKVIGKLDDE